MFPPHIAPAPPPFSAVRTGWYGARHDGFPSHRHEEPSDGTTPIYLANPYHMFSNSQVGTQTAIARPVQTGTQTVPPRSLTHRHGSWARSIAGTPWRAPLRGFPAETYLGYVVDLGWGDHVPASCDDIFEPSRLCVCSRAHGQFTIGVRIAATAARGQPATPVTTGVGVGYGPIQ